MKDKRLILTQCFPPQRGGIETLMLGLARALHAHGEEIIVFADGGADARRYDLTSADDFTIRRFGGLKPLRRRIKAQSAATLAAAGATVFCDSWKSLEFLQSPAFAVFAHGSEFPLSPSARKKNRIYNTLARANTIFAVSQAAAQRAITCGGESQKIKIMPPPLLIPSLSTTADEQQSRQLWNGGAPRILTVARLTARKGIDRAIEAVAALSAEYPNLRYVIVGKGEQEKDLRVLAQRAGVAAQVCFAGAVDDGLKSALYASADIFVLPARAQKNDMEGFGIVYLEAGWFGLPCIGGNSGGAKEAVQDGKTGLLCDGESAASTRDALAILLKDTAMQKQMGEAAKTHAQTQTWQNRINGFL